MVRSFFKRWSLPLAVFVFWSTAIWRWTEGFEAFTTYSAALKKVGDLPLKAANLEFTTMHNKESAIDFHSKKFTLVEFMYLHCPNVCGILRARLYDFYPLMREELGKDISFLSISFDPKRDTPEILRQSWESLGSKPHWEFAALNGGYEEIVQNLKKWGFILYQDPKTTEFNHTALFFLLDPDGNVVDYINPALEIKENIKKIRYHIYENSDASRETSYRP